MPSEIVDSQRQWSLRARTLFILGAGFASWAAVIGAGYLVVRLVGV
jgi:hypothetical protein